MVVGLLVLFGCQLLGELAVGLFDLPVPGPVVGLVLLFGGLTLRSPAPTSGLARTCDLLLDNLALLFVPAGVGVVQYLPLVGAASVPLVAGLVLSWAAALVATALTAAVGISLLERVRR